MYLSFSSPTIRKSIAMDQIARNDPEVASNVPVTWPYISRPDPVALIGSSYLDSPLNPLILYSPSDDVSLETTSMLLPAQDLDSIQPKEDIRLVSSVLCPVDNDLGFNIVQEAPPKASTVLYQGSGNASDEGSITSHGLETSSVVSGYTQESFEAFSCCKIRLMCSFGGKILPRPSDGKLRYVGGDTRIINVNRNIKYMDLRNKMLDLCEQPLILKYQLPDEDLDALVSVTTDEDVENMMEEYDRLEVNREGSARLRIFLFFAAANEHEPKEFYDSLESSKHSEQQFVDAVNEIPDVVFTQHSRQINADATAELKVGLNVLPPSSLLSGGIMSKVSYPKYVFPEDWGRDLHNLKPVPYLLGPNLQDHIAADLPWHDQSCSGENAYQKDDSPAHRALCCQYGCANSPFPGTNDPMTSEELFNMVPLQGRECGATRARPVHGIGLDSNCLDVSCVEPQLHPSLAQSPPALSNRVLWTVEGQSQLSAYQGNHGGGGFIQQQKVLSEVPSVSSDVHHAIASHVCQTGPSTTPYHVLSETSHAGACPVMQQQQVFTTKPLMNARPMSEIHHGRAFHDCSHCIMPMQPMSSYFQTQNALPRHRELANASNLEVVQGMPISHKTVPGSGTRNLAAGGNDMIMEATKEYNDCQSQMQTLRQPTDRPFPSPFEHAGCHNDSVCDINHGSCIYCSPREQNTRMQQNEYLVGHRTSVPNYPVSPRASDGSYNYVMHKLPSFKHPLERSSEASVMPRPAVELNQGMAFGSSISHQETILPSGDRTADLEGYNLPKMEKSASEVGDIVPCDLSSGLIERDKSLIKEDIHSMISERTCDDSLVGKFCSNSMATQDMSICIMQSAKSTIDLNYTTSTPVVEVSGNALLETENGATDRKVEPCDVHVTSSLNITPSSNDSLATSMAKVSITNNASVDSTISLHGEPLGHMNTFAAETDDKDLQDKVVSDFNVHTAIPSEGKDASVNGNSDEKGAVDQGNVVKTIEDNQFKGGGDAQVPIMASIVLENNLEIPSAVTEAEAIAHGFQVIKNADLEEIKALGSGTYGTVYYGKWRGSDVAIKRIKSSCFDGRPSERERLIADFWKEAYLLAQLHHPNVVAFYGVVPDGPDGTLATVTEYMVNGSLKQVLQRKDRTIDRRKRLLIAMDAAFGMEYLHGKNIVHFDLKCENLLVNMRDPQRPVCKVADLGLSKVKHKTMVSGGVRGTLPWMAPELLSPNSMVTEKVDVFSFGIMMWELLTGEEPYADMHQGAVIGGLVSGTLRPSIPAWCEPSWKSLMERCWSTDPKARPSFSEIASELRLMSASVQSRTQKTNG